MTHLRFALCLALLPVAGCVSVSSLNTVQARCDETRTALADLASCVEMGLDKSDPQWRTSSVAPYAQEYLAIIRVAAGQVQAGKMTEPEAMLRVRQVHAEMVKRVSAENVAIFHMLWPQGSGNSSSAAPQQPAFTYTMQNGRMVTCHNLGGGLQHCM
jgi:outer membrane murein-binding lipoprotein Lpp